MRAKQGLLILVFIQMLVNSLAATAHMAATQHHTFEPLHIHIGKAHTNNAEFSDAGCGHVRADNGINADTENSTEVHAHLAVLIINNLSMPIYAAQNSNQYQPYRPGFISHKHTPPVPPPNALS